MEEEDGCTATPPWVRASAARSFDGVGLVPHTATAAALDALRRRIPPRAKAELRLGYRGAQAEATVISSSLGEDPEGKLGGMRAVLISSMRRCARTLRLTLDGRALVLFMQFLDFPVVHRRASTPSLPFFAMASSPRHTEVAVPDFTFHRYSKILGMGSPTSWERLAPMIARSSDVPLGRRAASIFWRGSVQGSKLRRRVAALLNGTESVSGVRIDVADSGWFGARHEWYVRLEEQCSRRYLLHLRGNGYSAGLKYKLACGSLLILLRDPPYAGVPLTRSLPTLDP